MLSVTIRVSCIQITIIVMRAKTKTRIYSPKHITRARTTTTTAAAAVMVILIAIKASIVSSSSSKKKKKNLTSNNKAFVGNTR